MWAKFMETKNGYTAEIWKELFNAEALSVRVVPGVRLGERRASSTPARSTCRGARLHVAAEILRKI